MDERSAETADMLLVHWLAGMTQREAAVKEGVSQPEASLLMRRRLHELAGRPLSRNGAGLGHPKARERIRALLGYSAIASPSEDRITL